MNQKILVTGGAGFIGSHIVDALLERGQQPVVLDNLATGTIDHIPEGVERLIADVADPAVVDLIEGMAPAAIIHAAAQASVPHSMADPDNDRAINLLGTAHMIEAASRLGKCKIVFLSTGGGIYGDTDRPATENSLPRPKSFYSVHKYAAERYLEYSGIPYAIARLANVYGPRQRSDLEGGVAAIFAERVQRGQGVTIYGTGEQIRDFVHVRDVVRALLVMLDEPTNGMWNVGTGQETSVNELLACVLATQDRPVPVTREPGRVGDVFRSCLSIDKIRKELGWEPMVSLETGIASLMSRRTALVDSTAAEIS